MKKDRAKEEKDYAKEAGKIDWKAYPDGRDPYADSTTEVMRMAWTADEFERQGKIIRGGRIYELLPVKNEPEVNR